MTHEELELITNIHDLSMSFYVIFSWKTSGKFMKTLTCTLQETIEEGQAEELAKEEKEEEYDTADSDAEQPIADSDKEDTFDNFMFFRAITTPSGQMFK